MNIEFDPLKRETTLEDRGLDFACAAEVFSGRHFTAPDLRQEYSEQRFITVGLLESRMVVLVWTPRGEARRIASPPGPGAARPCPPRGRKKPWERPGGFFRA